jgi:hypothetical protein
MFEKQKKQYRLAVKLSRNPIVRTAIIGAAGAVIYTKVMGANGYKMVRPGGLNAAGELVVISPFGRAFRMGIAVK